MVQSQALGVRKCQNSSSLHYFLNSEISRTCSWFFKTITCFFCVLWLDSRMAFLCSLGLGSPGEGKWSPKSSCRICGDGRESFSPLSFEQFCCQYCEGQRNYQQRNLFTLFNSLFLFSDLFFSRSLREDWNLQSSRRTTENKNKFFFVSCAKPLMFLLS